MTTVQESAVFDGRALVDALDRARLGHDLGWPELADGITMQSRELRARSGDHDVCSGALVRTVRRWTMSCQYALMLLQWLDRAPEHFLSGPSTVEPGAWGRLPVAGPDRRLRWDLPALHADLQRARVERGWTWSTLAEHLECTPGRLTTTDGRRGASRHRASRPHDGRVPGARRSRLRTATSA